MENANNLNYSWLDGVEDKIRESLKEFTSKLISGRSGFREALNLMDRSAQIVEKHIAKRIATLASVVVEYCAMPDSASDIKTIFRGFISG